MRWFQHHRPDPEDALTLEYQVPGPVLPEELIPKAVDNGAEETWDDVDEQEEDVADLQAQQGEDGDESSLQGGNHEGQHAQQQLRRETRTDLHLLPALQVLYYMVLK